MAKNLVIVESPAKAKTINKFIGKDYVVKASVGHVRDLPKSELGVDEETFEPTYEVLEGKQKVVNELKAIVGPDAWVTFGDAIESEQIFEYLRGIDLLCCPSRTLEGGPTVALEAMAVGTPVIGTRQGALSEMIEDGANGRLVPPADWRALARALREVAANAAEIIPRWRAALPPMRSMDDVVDDYLRLYS